MADCSGQVHEQKDKDGIRMDFYDGFYLFKCIWTPDKITYYINGVETHEVINSGQEWFPKIPLEVRLSQQILDPINDPIVPQTSYFNYIDIKQFFLAPEITVPSYICSTGTATLDVDPLASNITWQLTPSSLFATSSGTGKTANIVKAPIESGMGKITYTFQMPSGETFTAEKSFRIGLTGSFTGSASVAYKGTGIWNAVASCGTAPYSFEWWLREEGTGVEAQLVATGSQLRLLSVPRTTMAANQQEVKTDTNPIINQPVTYTYYDLYLRVVDGNGVKYIEYTTPEQRIIASGNVDLVSRSLNRMADALTVPANGILINAFPNPTGSATTIELAGEKIDSMNVSTAWDMEVYDPYSMLKTKANNIQGKTYKINTSDWKDGVYVLRAKVKDEVITEKLFVKH